MKIYSLFLILIFSVSSFAQRYIKVTYDYESKQPTMQEDSSFMTERFYLFTNKSTSLFQSRSRYLRDSVIQANMGKAPSDYISKVSEVPSTPSKFSIYKNHDDHSILFAKKILKEKLKYEESMDVFNWEIQSSQRKIGKFNCSLAKTTYEGREYYAWFSGEIPILEGPYKFCGLPGLIIEIYDKSMQHRFILKGLEYQDRFTLGKESLLAHRKVSKGKFNLINKRFMSNPVSEILKRDTNFEITSGGQKLSASEINKNLKDSKTFNNPIFSLEIE